MPDASQYLMLALIKFAAYTLYARSLVKRFTPSQPVEDLRTARSYGAGLIGACRTLLGIALGSAYVGLIGLFSDSGVHPIGPVLTWSGFFPLRVFEWWLTLRVFFPRRPPRTSATAIAGGIFVSYLADIPVLFGFIVTAGRIC
jgi:hypothetical protein